MNKFQRKFALFSRLQNLGFTFDEAQQLRRIEMTLHRWAELECGDGNDHSSWAIERDESSGKPFMHIYPHTGKSRRYPVADRETGALKRLARIIANRNARQGEASATGQFFGLSRKVLPYHQTDPRGCALYIVPENDIPPGAKLESCYTNGVAVAA